LVLKRVSVGCDSWCWWRRAAGVGGGGAHRGSLTAAARGILLLLRSTNAKWINRHEADLNEYYAVQGVGGVRVM
jgi:hypothetical protein